MIEYKGYKIDDSKQLVEKREEMSVLSSSCRYIFGKSDVEKLLGRLNDKNEYEIFFDEDNRGIGYMYLYKHTIVPETDDELKERIKCEKKKIDMEEYVRMSEAERIVRGNHRSYIIDALKKLGYKIQKP